MALTPSCASLRHYFGQKNPAENQKIESEKPVMPGIPGQISRRRVARREMTKKCR